MLDLISIILPTWRISPHLGQNHLKIFSITFEDRKQLADHLLW